MTFGGMKKLDNIKNKSGIYEIYNTINNKRYIGQSIHIRTRLLKHINLLNKNAHPNKHLQNSWDKYGYEHFEFKVLEYCFVDELDSREDYYILLYHSNNSLFGFNYRIDNKTNRGLKWSEEQREKMRSHISKEDSYYKNHIIPKETMEKAWAALRNKVWTKEERTRHSIILTGTKVKNTSNMKKAQTGEGNNSHKLSEKEVIEIINLLNMGYKTVDLSLLYDVSRSNISLIKNGRSWECIDRQSVLTPDNKERGLAKIYEYNKSNKRKIEIQCI